MPTCAVVATKHSFNQKYKVIFEDSNVWKTGSVSWCINGSKLDSGETGLRC